MILAIDVGNTQTTFGLFQGEVLSSTWRVSTNREETADELAVVISNLLSLNGNSFKDIKSLVVSSVVPHCTTSLEVMSRKYNLNFFLIKPGVKTGLSILYEDPREVGADRISNSVAAAELFTLPCIVVDFGTATTFDVISKNKEYLGGAISPGLESAAEALFERAARLSWVELEKPGRVIGKNTRASLQSGILYGFAGLVDSMVEKIEKELGEECEVIATGGLSPLIAPISKKIKKVDLDLTLKGLKIIYEKNFPQE